MSKVLTIFAWTITAICWSGLMLLLLSVIRALARSEKKPEEKKPEEKKQV